MLRASKKDHAVIHISPEKKTVNSFLDVDEIFCICIQYLFWHDILPLRLLNQKVRNSIDLASFEQKEIIDNSCYRDISVLLALHGAVKRQAIHPLPEKIDISLPYRDLGYKQAVIDYWNGQKNWPTFIKQWEEMEKQKPLLKIANRFEDICTVPDIASNLASDYFKRSSDLEALHAAPRFEYDYAAIKQRAAHWKWPVFYLFCPLMPLSEFLKKLAWLSIALIVVAGVTLKNGACGCNPRCDSGEESAKCTFSLLGLVAGIIMLVFKCMSCFGFMSEAGEKKYDEQYEIAVQKNNNIEHARALLRLVASVETDNEKLNRNPLYRTFLEARGTYVDPKSREESEEMASKETEENFSPLPYF